MLLVGYWIVVLRTKHFGQLRMIQYIFQREMFVTTYNGAPPQVPFEIQWTLPNSTQWISACMCIHICTMYCTLFYQIILAGSVCALCMVVCMHYVLHCTSPGHLLSAVGGNKE